jgi:GT2 family glycosyltransferase
MDLSIIIPTRDRGTVFDETLRSAIQAVAHINAEILVVNDSRNSMPAIPSSSVVAMINNPGKGVAAARNAGVRSTNGALLLFLDDDILISKRSIDHILKVHRENQNMCLNLNWEYPPDAIRKIETTQFGRFLISNQMTSFKGWYNDPSWKENALFNSKSVASFHLSMKREDFNKTPGYNEQFPHAGFEDYDFPLRLKDAGMTFWIDSRETVYHNEIDRINFNNWLANQERRATTRKVAVDLGYKELALQYPALKRFIFSLMSTGSSFVRAAMLLTPNIKLFDPLFFTFIGSLQAYRIYKGYREGKST